MCGEQKQEVYEYECSMLQANGSIVVNMLVALDDDHAMEEASYEFEGKCVAVKRGEFLYYNELPQ